MKIKKNLLLILILSLSVMMFAACGGKSTTATTTENDETNTKEATTTESVETDAEEATTTNSVETDTDEEMETDMEEADGNIDDTSSDESESDSYIEVPITIVNLTGVEIYELYASPSNNNDWGDDILEEETLADQEYGTANFQMDVDSVVWDFAATDDSGNALYFYELDFSNCDASGVTMALAYDEDSGYYAYFE